jgi:hypothetical protein
VCCLALKLSDFVELIIVNKLLLPHEGQQKLKLLSLLSLPGKQHIWSLLSSTENKELNLVESSLRLHIQRNTVEHVHRLICAWVLGEERSAPYIL